VTRTTRRRRTRLDTGPWRSALVLAVGLAVAVAIPLMVWRGARRIITSNVGSVVTTTTVTDHRPVVALPATPVALLVSVGTDRRANGFVVISRFPGGGGFVIQLPLTARVQVPGGGTDSLADAYDTGGLEQARQSVASALDVAIDLAAEADPAHLSTALSFFAPFEVTLADPVEQGLLNGRTARLFPAGDVSIEAKDVPTFLAARTVGQTAASVLPRQEQLWRSIVSAVKAKSSGPVGDSSTIGGFLAGLGQGTYVTTTAPLDPTFRPDGEAGVPLDPIRTRMLVAQAMPGAVSPSSTAARYRIVNTTGDPDVALAAVTRLSFFGANIISVGDTPGPLATTTFEWADDVNTKLAQGLPVVFGAGQAQRGGQIVQGVDVTITLGADFAKVVADQRAQDAATTTTTTAPTSTVPARRGKG